MEFKGTKGKWFVDKGIDTISINCKNFPAGIDGIAKIENQFKSDVSSANALLMSKAPEMLEMLKLISEKAEEIHDEPDGEDNRFFDEIDFEKLDNLIKSATEL